ncbi:hypothetical protein [Paenibacillus chitinolyticus]|uniref:hypothetical protein n=1 Tax=Paenibacillus chitinolyticus TaxID=79263 RepID=UPI00366CA526
MDDPNQKVTFSLSKEALNEIGLKPEETLEDLKDQVSCDFYSLLADLLKRT